MAEVCVRDLDGAAEMTACESLYASVLELRPNDGSINPRLLIALQANSGIVLGAFVDQVLVGFAYSFLARERAGRHEGSVVGDRLYQYSQLVVVATEHQGTGIGRALKAAQRQRCLADGITLLRWAFDPLKTRNAYFNLDVLGGRLVALVPSMYGTHGFGADAGDDTDRFIVDWDLTEAPDSRPCVEPGAEVAAAPGRTFGDGDDLLITVPADWPRYRAAFGPGVAAALRRDLRTSFARVLDSGRIGVSCRRVSEDVFAYRFAPAHSQHAAHDVQPSRP
jgi:predicted GNAT superfamily acetyltransferase